MSKDIEPGELGKQFRRLTTRFDKLKQNFQVTVAIACITRWLRQYVDTP
jgi:hypothetical protein